MNRLLSLNLLLLTLFAAPSIAEDAPPKDDAAPQIFLDKAPRIVEFQLKQLTNGQLTKLERKTDHIKYIPIYSALLTRPGLEAKYRREAVEALAKLNKADVAAQLVAAIKRVDEETDEETQARRTATLRELAAMLLREKKESLTAAREDLAAVAGDSNNAAAKQIGYAGLILADGGLDKAMELTASKEHGQRYLFGAAALIKDKPLLDAIYPAAITAIKETSDDEIRAAAAEAISHVPGKELGAFAALLPLLTDSPNKPAAISALRRIAPDKWPPAGHLQVVQGLLKYLEETPAEERTSPVAITAVELGHDAAAKLPADQAAPIRAALGRLGVRIIKLSAPREQMLFDQRWVAVEAGKPVQVVFENTDVMPHNFVLIKPGSLEEIGMAAESMQPSTDPAAHQFVPVSTKVLASMQLVQMEQTGRLSFTAPTEPGEYPYVCTYPGHWRRMYGVMVVVKDLDAFMKSPKEPADPLGSTRSLVKAWTMDDFKGKLTSMEKADAARGKAIFAEAGCVLCHKVKGQGGAVGPELAEVFKKWKGSREDLLREVIEPSKVIDDKYRPTIIETQEGDRLFGVITEETADAVMIVTNPQKPVPQKLLKRDIAERSQGQTSMMPLGLMNIFKADEVLDLLKYLEAGGEVKGHEHKH